MDLIYLAKNRLEFTQASLPNLVKNTNWNEVNQLLIYDDASSDGTREYLENYQAYPIRPTFRFGVYGSPVQVMNEYLLRDAKEALFAKIDSDTMVPEFWLEECLRINHLHPGLHLIGIEAFRPVVPGRIEWRSFDRAEFIGGIGLMQTRAFFEVAQSLPVPNGRFGFTEWQQKNPAVEKGWLNPALPVFLLDWLPREPFRSLSAQYALKGWGRDWSKIFPEMCPYPETRSGLWRWWRD